MEIDSTSNDSSESSYKKRKYSDVQDSCKVKIKTIKSDEEIREPSSFGVFELHKYCMKNKLELPCYKIHETTDYQNVKIFYVQCNIKTVVTNAYGSKKKEAKHKASSLLLAKLKYNAQFGMSMNYDDDGLEEGEIYDLEEGEITEMDTNMVVNNEDNVMKTTEDLIKEDTIYKSSKVYMEGNVCKSNVIIYNSNLDNSFTQQLVDFCLEQRLPSAKYEFVKFDGINVPIFTCKCSVLQLTVKANGPNKSSVKEKASKLLLEKMIKLVDLLKPQNGDRKNIFEVEEGEIIEDDDCKANRKHNSKRFKPTIEKNMYRFNYRKRQNPFYELGISDLYNYCLKLNIPTPIYVLINKVDFSPIKTVFTFKCSVLRFSQIGKGYNKRQAQHRAARLVLKKLQIWNKDKVNQDEEDESELEEGEITAKEQQLKKEFIEQKLQSNFVSCKEKDSLHLLRISETHNIIKTENPYTDSLIIKSLKDLDDTLLHKYAYILLECLCKELDCTYDILNVKSTNITFLKLNTTPQWSVFAEDQNPVESQKQAIIKLLKFLKIMSE